MTDVIETIKYKGYEIKISHDDSPIHPREEWDNLGTMLCFHSRYQLGDKHSYTVEEAQAIANNKDNIVLSLNLYDHSGITMSTSNGYPYNDQWDAGCVGFIYISKAKVREEYGWKKITAKRREQIEGYLKGEVETYDNFLTGSVYGYEIELPDQKEDELDESCWGYFGYDHEASGLKSDAISYIEWHIEDRQKRRNAKLKALIKNKVPVEKRTALLEEA